MFLPLPWSGLIDSVIEVVTSSNSTTSSGSVILSFLLLDCRVTLTYHPGAPTFGGVMLYVEWSIAIFLTQFHLGCTLQLSIHSKITKCQTCPCFSLFIDPIINVLSVFFTFSGHLHSVQFSYMHSLPNFVTPVVVMSFLNHLFLLIITYFFLDFSSFFYFYLPFSSFSTFYVFS
jgi:hypothetical protein